MSSLGYFLYESTSPVNTYVDYPGVVPWAIFDNIVDERPDFAILGEEEEAKLSAIKNGTSTDPKLVIPIPFAVDGSGDNFSVKFELSLEDWDGEGGIFTLYFYRPVGDISFIMNNIGNYSGSPSIFNKTINSITIKQFVDFYSRANKGTLQTIGLGDKPVQYKIKYIKAEYFSSHGVPEPPPEIDIISPEFNIRDADINGCYERINGLDMKVFDTNYEKDFVRFTTSQFAEMYPQNVFLYDMGNEKYSYSKNMEIVSNELIAAFQKLSKRVNDLEAIVNSYNV